MRETAARFAANPTVEVTATQMNRDLAAAGKEFVSIEGDKAIWKNHWLAGGNEITWDMVLRRAAHRRRGAPSGQDRRDGYR